MKSKKLLALMAASALALGGCSLFEKSGGPGPKFSPTAVDVIFDNGLPTVKGGILIYGGRRGEAVTITWTLPQGYRFDRERGIDLIGEVIDEEIRTGTTTIGLRVDRERGRAEIDCKFVGDRQYQCLNKRSRTGIYKYAINVVDAAGKAISNDPPIINWVD